MDGMGAPPLEDVIEPTGDGGGNRVEWWLDGWMGGPWLVGETLKGGGVAWGGILEYPFE